MKKIQWGYWLVVLAVGLALLPVTGCASTAEQEAYYKAILEAHKAQKPLLEIQAAEGKAITGLKSITVYMPMGGANGPVAQYKDQWASVAANSVGVVGALGGIYLGGQAAIGLVDSVGKSAGHNSWSFSPSGPTGYGTGNSVSTPITVTTTDNHAVTGP